MRRDTQRGPCRGTRSPTVLHGVDFSGAADPRRKIWVSTLEPGAPATTRRGWTHAALREAIAGSTVDGRRHVWLIDAPLGLPVSLLESAGVELDWHATLDWLAGHAGPDAWRHAVKSLVDREPRRESDVRAGAPFSPINLRLYRQTWHALVSVVRPLSGCRGVCFPPMHGSHRGDPVVREASTWVAEGCPAATLRARAWPGRGYKGRGTSLRAARVDLLRRLGEDGVEISASAAAAARDDAEGDALDSLLLLPSARALARRSIDELATVEPRARIEGWLQV